jgi:hypothetical protein
MHHRPAILGWRYGHPQATHLAITTRRTYRLEVTQAMRTHRHSPELLAAIERTAALLNYTSCASVPHKWLTARMTMVREKHSARAVLQRVLEIYALIEHETSRFKCGQVEHLALARAVLFMARRRRPAYKSQQYRKPWFVAAGRLISEELGGFAITFVRDNLENT